MANERKGLNEMFKFQPDIVNWHKESKGTWVSNDGLRKCRKIKSTWLPSIRLDVEAEWEDSKWLFGALHAAQDECRRMMRTSHS